MPGFNGLGPVNAGPMTGRGRGYCMKVLEPGERVFYGGGRGMGRGVGRGMGFRGRVGYYWGNPDPNLHKAFLKERQAFLKQELNMIEEQLKEETQDNE